MKDESNRQGKDLEGEGREEDRERGGEDVRKLTDVFFVQ